MFITKYIVDGQEMSIYDIQKNKTYNLELEISGIWIFKKKYGLYLHIKRIFHKNI